MEAKGASQETYLFHSGVCFRKAELYKSSGQTHCSTILTVPYVLPKYLQIWK